MLTESSLGENVGEIQKDSSMIDLNMGIGNLSVSREASCVRPDASSASMVNADVSGADLLSAFGSISVDTRLEPRDQVDSSGQRPSDLVSNIEPSGQRDGEAEVSVGKNKTCKSNHPLIVYTSSRRRSARSKELNQNNESLKPSTSRTANENPIFDLNSLQISRRNRSSSSNRARSSVWGCLGNILHDFEGRSGPGLNVGNEKKVRGTSGKGKKNAMRDKTGRKSIGKRCPPTGHITLKVKIGNKLCSSGNATKKFSGSEKDIPEVLYSMENKFDEKVPADMVSGRERNLEKVSASDNPSFNTSGDFHQSVCLEEGGNLGASFENRCSEVGTSPDSEVINCVPEAPICEKGSPDIQDCPITPKALVSPGDASSLDLSQKKSKKGKKKDKLHQVDNCIVKSKTGEEATNNAEVPVHLEVGQKVDDISIFSDDSMITAVKPYVNDAETNPCSGRVAAIVSSNSQVNDELVPYSNGSKLPKCSGVKGGSKGRSRILELPSKKDKAAKKKGSKNNFGNQTSSDVGETRALSNDISRPVNGLPFLSDGLREQSIPPKSAWVLCEECQKWRRIPETLTYQIGDTTCRWTCKDNTDKDFADCSIPQEMSNSEINAELGISDASCDEDACGTLKSKQSRSKVAQQSSWSLIKSNLFLHRSRKTQTIDEVMVCHCKPPSDGRMGCGAKCLNRMLNIECVKGTCPCGELCSNQQFQRRKYAKLKWFKCGKKGYGIQALEDISQGQFLIEYVGEVLDVHAYEARQREYALDGHKHFYFMTLNGSEVIDACAKGNLGRFINHSCDPNCRTEKWMVNGEVCVGLFSLRDIKKSEEVTFDYNYVRVFGAAAKKCVCGSPNCRGYIGGDPTNSEVIVQDDSDDEFAEPVMTCGDKEMNKDWNEILSNSLNDEEHEIANGPLENRYRVEKLVSTAGQSIRESHFSETLTQKVEDVDSAKVVSFNRDSASIEQSGFIKISAESLSDIVESKTKSEYTTVGGKEELAISNLHGQNYGSLSSIKKGKPKINTVNDKRTPDADKLNAAVQKSKKLQELPLSSHFEAVEEKLNELLDSEGGISKRNDASRGYLKLLFLTAASGNNGHGEAIQSNRELSLILGALLKTKSRTVLLDIIDKNGLQMLHNMMKRYRKEFIKTPILRKLLKVLEYLATREILTSDHINGGPRYRGVESFRDSILILTDHADREVHQIARNFRDRWIPKARRRNFCTERHDRRTEFHQRSSNDDFSVHNHRIEKNGKGSDTINSCTTPSVASPFGTTETNETKTRKRKSRWDIPVDDYPHSKPRTNSTGDDEKMELDEDIPPGFAAPPSNSRQESDDDDKMKIDKDAPPGFSAPSTDKSFQESEILNKKLPYNIVLGESQSKFAARIPLSYGFSYSALRKCGVRQGEKSEEWKIALGVPFHPFPPLPPCTTSFARYTTLGEPAEKAEQFKDTCPMRSEGPSGKSVLVETGRSYNLGRYFRQQKLNRSKLAPPRVQMKNSGRCNGNNSRNGLPGVGLGNEAMDFRDSYNSERFIGEERCRH